MKNKMIMILLLSSFVFAGGDYGGGPKTVELHKLDHSVGLFDVKLSKDKKLVEVTVSYQKRRMDFDPFLQEKEANKLKFGKFASFILKYQKEVVDHTLVEKLEERKKFTIFTKKYKKLAREYFSIKDITKSVDNAEKLYFEVNPK